MTQPIDKLDYWKGRIAGAKDRKHEQYSVYEVGDEAWKQINDDHEKIIRAETPGKKTLDAGCGFGRFNPWIEDYTGVDFSPDFIAECHAKYPDKKFLVASLEKLPFKDKEFDIAVCGSIKGMIIGNLGAGVWANMERELKRVAKEVLILEYQEKVGVYV